MDPGRVLMRHRIHSFSLLHSSLARIIAPIDKRHARSCLANIPTTLLTLVVPLPFLVAKESFIAYLQSERLSADTIVIMADATTKDDKDALDALELEAKEFDKVRCSYPPPSAAQNRIKFMLTRSNLRMPRLTGSSKHSASMREHRLPKTRISYTL